MKLNLAAELQKGAHYYDIPQIQAQLAQAPRPLLENMERSHLDKNQSIPDNEPKVTARVRALWQDVLADTMRPDDYAAESWDGIVTSVKLSGATLRSLGRLVSLSLVGRSEEGGQPCYRYRLQFEKNTVLQRFVFDKQDKVVSCQVEDIR